MWAAVAAWERAVVQFVVAGGAYHQKGPFACSMYMYLLYVASIIIIHANMACRVYIY
jgi:hypothetical protein